MPALLVVVRVIFNFGILSFAVNTLFQGKPDIRILQLDHVELELGSN